LAVLVFDPDAVDPCGPFQALKLDDGDLVIDSNDGFAAMPGSGLEFVRGVPGNAPVCARVADRAKQQDDTGDQGKDRRDAFVSRNCPCDISEDFSGLRDLVLHPVLSVRPLRRRKWDNDRSTGLNRALMAEC
jgi:hypothetical protein